MLKGCELIWAGCNIFFMTYVFGSVEKAVHAIVFLACKISGNKIPENVFLFFFTKIRYSGLFTSQSEGNKEIKTWNRIGTYLRYRS